VATEAFDIGVSLAVMPWHWDAPDRDEPASSLHSGEPVMSRSEYPVPRRFDRAPPQVPSTLKAEDVSIHSPLIATLVATFVGVLGWVVMIAPH
jgi:hypothetical protein